MIKMESNGENKSVNATPNSHIGENLVLRKCMYVLLLISSPSLLSSIGPIWFVLYLLL